MTKGKQVKVSVKKKASAGRALASKAAAKVKTRPVSPARTGSGKESVRGASATQAQVKKPPAAPQAKTRSKAQTVLAVISDGKPKSTVKQRAADQPAAPKAQAGTKSSREKAPAARTADAAKAPARQTHAANQTKGAKSASAPLPEEEKVQLPSEFDGFKVNAHVVYPTHGVGKIIAVEAQEIAGTRLELFVISFEQEKMILRVPFGKAKAVGMRILSSRDTVRNALKTLRGRARVKRTMWSRRAQEYEAKINSGNLMLIAEVVRDLYRAEGQPEQSYSERQIYEAALERLSREVGAVEELDSGAALERVEGALKKAA